MLHECRKWKTLWFLHHKGCKEAQSHYSLMMCEVWNDHWLEEREANRNLGPVSFEFSAAVIWKTSHYSPRFRNEDRRPDPFWPLCIFYFLCVSFNLVLSETFRYRIFSIWIPNVMHLQLSPDCNADFIWNSLLKAGFFKIFSSYFPPPSCCFDTC